MVSLQFILDTMIKFNKSLSKIISDLEESSPILKNSLLEISPVSFCINIKNHNTTIKRLDEENINYVLNYDENSVETENVSHIDNVMYLLDITE